MNIEYVNGDLLSVTPSCRRVIPHICNNIGGWGSGFVVSLSNKWKSPEQSYRQWFRDKHYTFASKQILGTEIAIPFELGRVQNVTVRECPGTVVSNMIAQNGTMCKTNLKPIKYASLIRCMESIELSLRNVKNVEIHAPKFGAGLAGGRWDVIEELIQEIWVDNGLKVIVYNFDPNR